MVGRILVLLVVVTVGSLVTQRIDALLSRGNQGARVRVVGKVLLEGVVQYAAVRTIGRMNALTLEHSGTRSLLRRVATLLEAAGVEDRVARELGLMVVEEEGQQQQQMLGVTPSGQWNVQGVRHHPSCLSVLDVKHPPASPIVSCTVRVSWCCL